jgi:hypothetical protein
MIEETKPELVVMCAHGGSDSVHDERWPFGNMASDLLTHAACPVLVLQDRESLGSSASDTGQTVRTTPPREAGSGSSTMAT